MIREMKEELATVRGKESEVNHRKSDLEKQLEVMLMPCSDGDLHADDDADADADYDADADVGVAKRPADPV